MSRTKDIHTEAYSLSKHNEAAVAADRKAQEVVERAIKKETDREELEKKAVGDATELTEEVLIEDSDNPEVESVESVAVAATASAESVVPLGGGGAGTMKDIGQVLGEGCSQQTAESIITPGLGASSLLTNLGNSIGKFICKYNL